MSRFHRSSVVRFPLLPVPISGWVAVACFVCILGSWVLGSSVARADDTELLRANSSNPFLFILLDNSRSMAASLDDRWVHAGADDPRSRLYIAKEILYEELGSLSTVRYGLATLDQDEVRVVSKHYLYFVADTPANVEAMAGIPGALNGYPALEPGNQIESLQTDDATGSDGRVVEIDGDLLTLGRTFPFDGSGRQTPSGGTCIDPLDLATEREAINRYPKFGEAGRDTVTMWIEGNTGVVFRLRWQRPSGAAWRLGDDHIEVRLQVAEVGGCSPEAIGPELDLELELRLWKPFLWVDDAHGASFTAAGDDGRCGGVNAIEKAGGFWSLAPLDVDSAGRCSNKPFSGQGWEGNYDTGQPFTTNPGYERSLSSGLGSFDSYCDSASSNATGCVNLKHPTTYSTDPDVREADVGDLVPFHWGSTHHATLLSRLNPNHGIGADDFGVARYFGDTLREGAGSLGLVSSSRRPILAAGNSPIGAAVRDFRCWFVGEESDECRRNGSFQVSYGRGLLPLLRERDSGLWTCRRPFLIVITDLYGNCTQDDDVARVAGMFRETGESGLQNGVSTWLLNMGQSRCGGLSNAGTGRVIDIESRSEFRHVLRQILGEVEETSRTFAAAAVPAAQADVKDKIYFSRFTPLHDKGVWPGELLAFRKPVPTREIPGLDGATHSVPDEDRSVWDAGREMLVQSPDPGSLAGPYSTRSDLRIGAGSTERRVYYMVEPRLWNYFAPVSGSLTTLDRSETYSENDLRNDMWEAMGLVDRGPLTGETLHDIQSSNALDGYLRSAHSTLRYSLVEKRALDSAGRTLRNFVLGDMFHSSPRLMGSPSNSRYLADPESFPGYEEFSARHEKRRRMLFVGANDGMLHAFDAGRWQGSLSEGEFDDGSGREIFGYVPREAVRGLRALSENREDHRWFVDGTPQIADVWIDVSGDGAREWRTILFGGMRRGGRTVFALDVTQPDPVREVTRDLGGTTVTMGYLPTRNEIVPSCWDDHVALESGVRIPNDGDCDALPFGTPLWEITDSSDDDESGKADMGESWSSVEVGPIRIRNRLGDSDREELRWVAIFGGGFDPDGATDHGQGNWLYMADIESGEIIYKRRLGAEGSVAAPPKALDTDLDGVLDRVYVATTHGQLWRLDMSTVPRLVDVDRKCPKAAYEGVCIDEDHTSWDPVLFFDSLTQESDDQGNPVAQRRPFFFAPTAFYVGQLGGFGIAVGTGNRDDLWASGPRGGNRFYVFADEVCSSSTGDTSRCLPTSDLPLYESDLVDVTGGGAACGNEVVTDIDQRETGKRGWYLRLGQVPVTASGGEGSADTIFDAADERVVSPALTLSGLTVFNTYVPETMRTQASDGPRCTRRGMGRSYLLYTASGCALDIQESDTLVGDVFVDRNVTGENDPTQDTGADGESAADPCIGNEALHQEIRDTLFPSTCRFSELLRYPLLVNRSDTGVKCLVEMPLCIQQKNWKEF